MGPIVSEPRHSRTVPISSPPSPHTQRHLVASIVGALFAAASLIGCASSTSSLSSHAPTQTTTRFAVAGMACNACAAGIQSELQDTPGVSRASVRFDKKVATVRYNPNRVTPDQLSRVIEEAGYKASPLP